MNRRRLWTACVIGAAAVFASTATASADVRSVPVFFWSGAEIKTPGVNSNCQGTVHIRFEVDRAQPAILTAVLEPGEFRGESPDGKRACDVPLTVSVATSEVDSPTGIPFFQERRSVVLHVDAERPEPMRMDLRVGYGYSEVGITSSLAVDNPGAYLDHPWPGQLFAIVNTP